MATVIDSLLISLGFDTSEMKQGGDDAGNILESIKERSASLGLEMQKLRIELNSVVKKLRKSATPELEAEYKRLFLSVGNVKNEQKKLGEEAKKAGEHLKHQGHQGVEAAEAMKEKFMEVGKVMMEVFGIGLAIGGMVEFIHHTIEGAVAIDRLSKEAKMGVEDIQAWQAAVQKFGGTAEGVAQSINSLGMKVAVLGTKLRGARMASLALAQLGLSEVQVKGKQTGDVLDLIAKKVQGMDYYKAASMTRMLGLDPGLVRAMVEGGEELEVALAKAKKNALGPAEIKSMHEYEEVMIDIKVAVTNLGRHIVSDILPYLRKFVDGLSAVAEWARLHRGVIESAIIGIGIAISIMSTQAAIASGAFTAMWTAATLGLGPLAVGIIAAIIAGLVWVSAKFKNWYEGGQSAFGGFFQFLLDGFTNLWDLIKHVGSIFKDVWDLITGLITGDDSKIEKALTDLGTQIKDVFDDVFGWIEYEFWVMYLSIEKAISNLPANALKNLGKKIIDPSNVIKTGMKAMMPGLGGWLAEKGYEKVKNAIHNSVDIHGPITIVSANGQEFVNQLHDMGNNGSNNLATQADGGQY